MSAVALTSNLSHLAIGLGDGTVLLYRHLLQSLTTSPTSLTSLPKARVVLEANERAPEAITGLGFREGNAEKGSITATALYIVTTNRVLSASVSVKGGEAKVLDETGSGLGCAAMDAERNDMIVARDEAIYLYGPEGRGACYAYEGPKTSISVSKQNLVIVSPTIHGAAAGARRQVQTGTSNGSGVDMAKVTIFDLESKFISFTGSFRHGIRAVFAQWGDIYVYEGNGDITKLAEHSTSAKLDILYKRNLYTMALSLARSQAVAPATIADIHRLYGDYLYGKGDFDGAMSQFVKTLGYVQPSYVIRKVSADSGSSNDQFLDAQRINNLTTFLQELHSRGLANPDHTTLLLNCYTKTSDRARLDSFIKTEARKQDGETLPFDLETAIQVCRQAGFFEHATYLARKFGRHEDYLRIQIENAEEYDDAIHYLRSLGPQACEENLLRYGRSLLQHAPEATTELLIDLCSGTLGKKSAHAHIHSSLEDAKTANGGGTGGAVLSYLPGVNRLFGADGRESPPQQAPDTGGEPKESPGEVEEAPSYIPPSPRQFFAHFVDHRELFVHFLEDVAFALWGQKVDPSAQRPSGPIPRRDSASAAVIDDKLVDQRAVWNTLLELHLDSAATGDTSGKDKALALLASADSIPYDPMHALVLCSFSGFTDGLVGLWESLGMYEDVLRYWMEKDVESAEGKGDTDGPKPSDEVMRYLDLYGPENPSLYPMVLRYLTSSAAILSRHQDAVPGILETIDAERIMPPLAVVQLLSRNGIASVGTVKSWLRSKVEETRQEIEAVSSEVAWLTIGQGVGALLPLRDGNQGEADCGSDQHQPARGVPGDAVRCMWWTARSPCRALYVQAQLPPAVPV